MSRKILFCTAVSLAIALPAACFGATVDRSILQTNLDSLQDGQLFAPLGTGGQKWKEIRESELVFAKWPYRLRLIYVAREMNPQPRSGVIISKVGRTIGSGE